MRVLFGIATVIAMQISLIDHGHPQVFDKGEVLVNPRSLVVTRSCEEAMEIVFTEVDKRNLTEDQNDEAEIVFSQCVTAELNAANKGKPSEQKVVVVAPGEDGKLFFETISKSDAQEVRDACVKIGRSLLSATGPLGTVVYIATDKGQVQCDAYLRAAQKDNPLVVLAPNTIAGAALTVHALKLIGLKRPASEVQAVVDNIGRRLGAVVRDTFAEVEKNPLIAVMPMVLQATVVDKIIGKGGCRLKIRCRGLKCRHQHCER